MADGTLLSHDLRGKKGLGSGNAFEIQLCPKVLHDSKLVAPDGVRDLTEGKSFFAGKLGDKDNLFGEEPAGLGDEHGKDLLPPPLLHRLKALYIGSNGIDHAATDLMIWMR